MERIGIIGFGRAGGALGAALASAGYPVTGVSARSRASRERAARLLPHVPVLEPAEVVAGADVVVLAVPDDVIGEVATSLPFTKSQYAVHLSGAHGTAVLRGIAATPVALHPPMTFTDAPVSLAGVVFTATAPERALVERLVKDLGAEVQWIAEEQRALYHAGLVHGANHLVTLVSQALDVLREAGVVDPSATLRPLLTATLDNTLRSGHDALTGPIVRGDVETVQAHLAVLRGRPASTYAELARATVEMAAGDGRVDAETAARIVQVLERDRTGEAPR
ncbi:putative short-subunit dehydrogenase-like oxidoreductase (DUF2520 family) [Kribbella voronezhensis]|uniref:Putative short-subunit dehydrogenase-like oxidoreductase (DUF2520 family) n=1 Tax=Kribbella voronezhensis TaxID=2512212 RepID=A0A4R7TGG9_9ACTN|nr:Rossmann-like and DUF2520 domain-containing protein [Kribbella voronezhensis]TDU90547.1 putative short-subunit dehydrogenase-like oxidoreductase (DUF2520 family) [Kribbella voronezhensis]